MADLDAETRDAIRDLCVGVALMAQRCWSLLGTDDAGEVIANAQRLCERMDELDEQEKA